MIPGLTGFDKCGQEKDGVNAGVSGIIRHYPDRHLNVVFLSNMEEGVWEPMWDVHRLIDKGAFDL